MHLFKQPPAVSRGRYAAHLFTNCIHGEEIVCAQREWTMGELFSALSLCRTPHAARIRSHDEQER